MFTCSMFTCRIDHSGEESTRRCWDTWTLVATDKDTRAVAALFRRNGTNTAGHIWGGSKHIHTQLGPRCLSSAVIGRRRRSNVEKTCSSHSTLRCLVWPESVEGQYWHLVESGHVLWLLMANGQCHDPCLFWKAVEFSEMLVLIEFLQSRPWH